MKDGEREGAKEGEREGGREGERRRARGVVDLGWISGGCRGGAGLTLGTFGALSRDVHSCSNGGGPSTSVALEASRWHAAVHTVYSSNKRASMSVNHLSILLGLHRVSCSGGGCDCAVGSVSSCCSERLADCTCTAT